MLNLLFCRLMFFIQILFKIYLFIFIVSDFCPNLAWGVGRVISWEGPRS